MLAVLVALLIATFAFERRDCDEQRAIEPPPSSRSTMYVPQANECFWPKLWFC